MTKKSTENSEAVFSLAGVFPPLPTPFDEKGAVDADALKNNISRLNRFPLGGYVILGSNGEFVLLTEAEKLRVIKAAREAIPPGKMMIAGTGCPSTGETGELSRRAASLGADAVLVLPPHYYRGLMTREVLTRHYFAVADVSPVPVLVYNIPANTGIDLDAETVAALAEHPNIVGMKDSGGNIVKIGVLTRQARGFQILAGSGSFLLPALSVGAVGGIMALANIAPRQCLAIPGLFHRGEIKAAREIQNRMIPVNEAVTRRWGVPALKAALDHLGLYGGPVRPPLLPLPPETRAKLEEILGEGDIEPMQIE